MAEAGEHDFTVVNSTDIYRGAIMALRRDEVVMPGGHTAFREVVEHSGAVAVVALNERNELLLERQYRHPIAARLWELPAGILDILGEEPLAAAQRELVEETSLAAKQWDVVVDTITSPGFADESVRVFLARDLYEVTRPQPEEEERDMTLHWVDLESAVDMVMQGEIVNSIAVAGILAVSLYLRRFAAKEQVYLRNVEASWPLRAHRFPARRSTD